MNDYWHIPRASLSPSSASSAVSTASSTQRSQRSQIKQKLAPTHYRQKQQQQTQQQQVQQQKQQQQQQQHQQAHQQQAGVVIMEGNGGRRDSEMSATTNAAVTAAAAAAVLAAAKRGSRSSQGSNDSNNSTRSAASGSLLLTAANLERMTAIHKKQQQQQQQHRQLHQQQHRQQHQQNNHLASSIYNTNLVQVARDYQLTTVPLSIENMEKVDHPHYRLQHHRLPNTQNQLKNDAAAIINIDPNLNFIKTKDLDSVSIASSMHFTMVNGEAGANKKTKKGLCDRGRQVTVLIVTMSTIFLLLIIGMVYALEMRAREMPQS